MINNCHEFKKSGGDDYNHSLYLPDKNLLQRKLAEWIQEYEDEKAMQELAKDGGAE